MIRGGFWCNNGSISGIILFGLRFFMGYLLRKSNIGEGLRLNEGLGVVN